MKKHRQRRERKALQDIASMLDPDRLADKAARERVRAFASYCGDKIAEEHRAELLARYTPAELEERAKAYARFVAKLEARP